MFESNINDIIANTDMLLSGIGNINEGLVDNLINEAYKDITNECSKINLANHIDNIQKVINKNEGIISTNDEVVIYKEMGTGVVGSEHPHPNPNSEFAGWVYDVNNHGEKGWWYPTTEGDPNPYKTKGKDGVLRAWTKGLPSSHMFYDAYIKMTKNAPKKALVELNKNIGKMY